MNSLHSWCYYSKVFLGHEILTPAVTKSYSSFYLCSIHYLLKYLLMFILKPFGLHLSFILYFSCFFLCLGLLTSPCLSQVILHRCQKTQEQWKFINSIGKKILASPSIMLEKAIWKKKHTGGQKKMIFKGFLYISMFECSFSRSDFFLSVSIKTDTSFAEGPFFLLIHTMMQDVMKFCALCSNQIWKSGREEIVKKKKKGE